MIEEYDFERTMALGRRSLGHLGDYGTPAVPRHYEVFYTYASGHNRDLNEAIRAIITRRAPTRFTHLERGSSRVGWL